MHTQRSLKKAISINQRRHASTMSAVLKIKPVLTCIFVTAATFMTSCATVDRTVVNRDAQIEQDSPVFASTLPLLLDYLAAQRGDWTYDQLAKVFSIGRFDDISSWKASWENRVDSPFVEGIICKDLTVDHAPSQLFISGCSVYINKNFRLSLIQYSKILGVKNSQIMKALADGDRFIESRHKTLNVRAMVEDGYVVSVVMAYQPLKPWEQNEE